MRSLCPLLGLWEKIPFGISRRRTHTSVAIDGMDYFLVLPLLPWWARRYELTGDDFARGWWLGRLMFVVRIDQHKPGFEVHFRWGLQPLRVTYENPNRAWWPL